MPLIQKPRNPNYGVRRVRRNPNKRKRLNASPLPETVMYIDMQKLSRGRVIDDAIQLHREQRREFKQLFRRTNDKGQPISTQVAPDTLAYIQATCDVYAITPGELIDDAIRLYRQVNE